MLFLFLEKESDMTKKVRLACRFLLSNLHDFKPKKHELPIDQLNTVDKYILHKLNVLIEEYTNDFNSFSYHSGNKKQQ